MAAIRIALVLAFLAIAVSASGLSDVERLMSQLNLEQKEWVQRMRGGNSANFTQATHLPICRDLVIPDGVPCEEFSVQTEDGFQLNLIHLPPLQAGAPVVYLQHGLLSAASVWVDQDTSESLGYLLRSQGYDVWAGNSRGNWYSLQNVNYPVTDRALWDAVDFDTMAQYDLPAFINFILSTTGKSTLAYIGHSQGTTQAFAAFSQGYGSLCSQVSIFIAMAPVSRCMNIKTKVFQQLASLHADALVGLFGWASWPPLNMDALTVLEKLNVTCDSPDRDLCENIVYDIGGATQSWVNQTQQKEDLGFDPAGTSMHNMQHWLQGMRYDGFRMYNYGVGNLAKYGQLNPPVYDLSKVCVPMAIFSGGLDELAVPVDVEWTISQLPADKIHFQKVLPSYQHNDFVWSMNAHTELYPDVIAQIQAHLPGAALAKANTLLNINKEKKN